MIVLLEIITFIVGYIKMVDIKSKLSFIPWKFIVGAGILVSLFIGMFTIDNRFAKSGEVIAMAQTITKDRNAALLLAEAEAVTTFQGLQQQQAVMNKTLQLQMLQHQKEWKDTEYINLKRQLRLHPNDTEVIAELEAVRIERIVIKEKIEKKILEK